MKKCTYCAEEIRDDAIKCRYCGEVLVAKAYSNARAESSQRDEYELPDEFRAELFVEKVDSVYDGADFQGQSFDNIYDAQTYGENLLEVGHKGYCIWLNGNKTLAEFGGILYWKITDNKLSKEWAATYEDVFLYEAFNDNWLQLFKKKPCPVCGNDMTVKQIVYLITNSKVREAVRNGYFIKGQGPFKGRDAIDNTKPRFWHVCSACRTEPAAFL